MPKKSRWVPRRWKELLREHSSQRPNSILKIKLNGTSSIPLKFEVWTTCLVIHTPTSGKRPSGIREHDIASSFSKDRYQTRTISVHVTCTKNSAWGCKVYNSCQLLIGECSPVGGDRDLCALWVALTLRGECWRRSGDTWRSPRFCRCDTTFGDRRACWGLEGPAAL